MTLIIHAMARLILHNQSSETQYILLVDLLYTIEKKTNKEWNDKTERGIVLNTQHSTWSSRIFAHLRYREENYANCSLWEAAKERNYLYYGLFSLIS